MSKVIDAVFQGFYLTNSLKLPVLEADQNQRILYL